MSGPSIFRGVVAFFGVAALAAVWLLGVVVMFST
jgi:hypothetical protein